MLLLKKVQVRFLKWGITGWRLLAYLGLLSFISFWLLYLLIISTHGITSHQSYEYSNFYCFTPGPVYGKEGVLPISKGHLYSLVQVQAVIRHGDRAPIVTNALPNTHPVQINCMFNNTEVKFVDRLNKFKQNSNIFSIKSGAKHPITREVETCSGGQLTPFGFAQHIFNGEHLQRAYKGLFADAELPKDTLIYSTSYDRTVQSASALLFGIFQDKMENKDGLFNIHVIPKQHPGTDFLIDGHGLSMDCPSISKEILKIRESVEMRAVKLTEVLQRERYASLFNAEVSMVPSINKIVDIMVTRLCHGQELPIGPGGAIDSKLAESSFELSHRHITAEHRPVSEIQTTSILSHIVQNIANSFKMSGFRRLVLYSGHDSTIAPLLLNLGASDGKWPRYASRVIFEVWKMKSSVKTDDVNTAITDTISFKIRNLFIRVLYNGEVITGKIRFCKNAIVDRELCPAENLFHFVTMGDVDSGLMFKKIQSLCNIADASEETPGPT